MSGIFKGGWHPEGKGGKKESWRGDFKGINQIAGKFGKGQSSSSQQEDRAEHVSRPLNSLKDPSSFAPPPKHIAYHGATALPNATTPDAGGWGAPSPQETVQQQQQQQAYPQAYQQAAEEEEEEKPPPGPYRVDTTGLSTSHLPPPPVRRNDGSTPSPRLPGAAIAAPPKPAPRLPPRLPPRQNSRPDMDTPEPPPAYNDTTQYTTPDQGALNRLGQSGVSVPGFDIGRTSSPKPPPRTHVSTPPGAPQAQQVNELQARFARMTAARSPSSSSSQNNDATPAPAPTPPSQGTTWEQKQASMNTARSFHKDPSSVSLSDAKNAASTANNFRERHGEQVASGMQSARNMSQKYGQQAKDVNAKYGISNKLSGYASSAANFNRSAPSAPSPVGGSSSSAAAGVAAKKAPPPPPPKKRDLAAPPPLSYHSPSALEDSSSAPPPPVPMSSKPR